MSLTGTFKGLYNTVVSSGSPSCGVMSLGTLRYLSTKSAPEPHIVEFLESVKDLPDNTMVQLAENVGIGVVE